MFRRIFSIFLFCLLLTPTLVQAETVPAGVADRALWFSKEPFFEGEGITIYTLLFNSGTNQLSGTLTLSDGTTTIAAKTFTVVGGGASSVVAFPWKVTGGSHVFSAAITSKEFLTTTLAQTNDTVSTPKTGEVKRFADLDTDADGLGNKTDTDDDNDGLADLEEKKNGTNPLAADTDGDGIIDKLDPHPLVKEVTKKILEPETAIAAEPATLPTAVADKLPEPVLNTAIPVIGAIESYRLKQETAGEASLQKTIGELASHATSSVAYANPAKPTGWEVFKEGALSEDVMRTPFQYVKLLFQILWQSILGNTYIFYLLLLFLAYSIARFIWGIFF